MTIKTMNELIERLEAVRTDLDPRGLTLRQYERVGWALRPLDSFLDQCREEAASSRYTERRLQFYDAFMCRPSSIAAQHATRPLAATATRAVPLATTLPATLLATKVEAA
jgi:hypothetical protein